MLLSIPAWSWGTVPFLRGGSFLLIFVMTGMTSQLGGNLVPARPDHHGFLAVLFIVQLAAAFRIATGMSNRWTGFIMGVAGGIAIWASVEALLAQIVFALALAYFLLRRTDGTIGHIVSYEHG